MTKNSPTHCDACAALLARPVIYCPYCGRAFLANPGEERAAPNGLEKHTSISETSGPEEKRLNPEEELAKSSDATSQTETGGQSDDLAPPKQEVKGSLEIGDVPNRSMLRLPREARLVVALVTVAIGILIVWMMIQSIKHENAVVVEQKGVGGNPPQTRGSATKPGKTSTPSDDMERPSFSCSNAIALDEKTICGNSGLAVLENGMMSVYVDIVARNGGRAPPDVQDYATAALAKRRECRSDVDCIMGILLVEKSYFVDARDRMTDGQP